MDDHKGRAAIETSCTRVLRSLLTGERLVDVADHLTAEVVVSTPTVDAVSRGSVLLAIQDGRMGCDSLTEVSIRVCHLDVCGPRVYLEWQLSGRFTAPSFVDDDLLIEPTGGMVGLSGVMVVTLSRGRAAAITCYYDELALRRQLLAAS